MTLSEAKKLAQKAADEYGDVTNVLIDDLSEEEGEKYTFCIESAMDIMYPTMHSQWWKIVERVFPK